MTRVVAAELVFDAGCRLGEGPTWDGRTGTLLFVDIEAHRVHRFDPRTGQVRTRTFDQPVGVAVPRSGGGLLVGLADGFWVTDSDDGPARRLAEVEADDATTRMNDGKCDRRGRFWAGTMAYDERPGAGALYRLDADGSVQRVLDGVGISNGIGWSPDDRRMYYVDSLSHRVDVLDYDIETGVATGRHPWMSVPEALGLPDGLTVDREGGVWVAIHGAGRIQRYRPEGTLDLIVEVPAQRVTSGAFGGPSLDELYITSASSESDAPDPASTRSSARDRQQGGALFRCRPGHAGLPETPFGDPVAASSSAGHA